MSLGFPMGASGSVGLHDGAGTSKDGEDKDLDNAKKKLDKDKRELGKKLKKLNQEVRQAFRRYEPQSNAQDLQRIFKNRPLATNAQSDETLLRLIFARIDEIHKISSELGMRSDKKGHVRVDSASSLIDYLVEQPDYEKFRPSEIKELFEGCFKKLGCKPQHRLFCFSVFPEGSIVRKQVLMHWWIGEDLFDFEGPEFHVDEKTDEILSDYCDRGFIEPEMREGKVIGFKMNPVIRYVVIYLAEREGFMDFDFSWRPTANFSNSKRACLVNTEEGAKEGGTKDVVGTNSKQLMKIDNPEKLLALFYVSGDSHILKKQWFSSIRNVKIICLGRWKLKGKEEDSQKESEGKQEDIETCQRGDDEARGSSSSKSPTDGIKFLQGLKYLKNLKFLSLEGFSKMRELPVSASTLKNLIVLNLKDCDLLGALPNDIGLLRNLTHLDNSRCQRLKFMPKGLRQLTALEVLKGFVIDDEGRSVCKLDDLEGLNKLKKLSVIIRRRKPGHLHALKRFPSLKILKISWEEKVDGIKGLDSSKQWLPPHLEKLDLRRIPTDTFHIRVMPKKLKKLYIIDAKLSHLYLGSGEDMRILRLQNLPKFRMDLPDIIVKFAQLIYCKVVGCSKIEPFVDRTMEEMEFHKLDESSPSAWVKTISNDKKLKQDLGFKWSFL